MFAAFSLAETWLGYIIWQEPPGCFFVIILKGTSFLEESLPVYKDWDVRQITIKRLYKFLHESVNLEPELEQFIRTLIFSLEHSGQKTTAYLFPSGDQRKIQH